MKRVLPLLLLCALLTGCAPRSAEAQFFAMDAMMNATLYGSRSDKALDGVRQEIFRLDALLARTRPESDIARLNAAAGTGVPVAIAPETAALLQQAKGFAGVYAGAFDPTIAPVMDAWGFGLDEGYRVPTQEELQALLPLVDAEGLAVDLEAATAVLTAPGMEVDLGGIGKGYAADRAVAILKEYGISSALLSLGSSSIAAVGERPGGGAWRIGVRDPKSADAYLCILALSDRQISTSGAYERYFEEAGEVYHHILDPHTGAPSHSDLLSVTVVSPQGARADALSTALFVLGSREALDRWRAEGDYELVLVQTDGTVLVTEGLEEGLTFQGEGAGYRYEIIRR